MPQWLHRIRVFPGVLYRHHRVALVLAGALLAGSIIFGVSYWRRSSVYESVIMETLSAELMPTPQVRKGLEAFLMSGLPASMEAPLRTNTLSDQFVDEIRRLQKAVIDEKTTAPGVPQLILFHGNGGVVFRDEQPQGFLFLPSQILRPTLSPEQVSILDGLPEGPVPVFVTNAVSGDHELIRDIHFTAALVASLDNLSKISITGNPDHIPVQTYVITKNGVNRIFNGESGRRSMYQFPETTFFPSRPYFWPTFQPPEQGEPRKYSQAVEALAPRAGTKVSDYFAVSRPYMDLGGSGLVVTLTHGLWIAGYPRAAICFDVRLEPATNATLESLLAARIQQLGGSTVSVRCDTDGKDNPCNPDGSTAIAVSLARDMRRTLLAQRRKQQRAEILGNVYVFDSAARGGSLRGSIPLGPASAGSEESRRFLVFEIDLGHFHRLTLLIGWVAATLFGLVTLVLAYCWGAESQHDEELETTFTNVAVVMHNSPTPYVRVGSDDVIRDFSASFLKLLGLSSEDAEKLKTKRFESFLADEASDKEYENVRKSRLGGKDVEPYELLLSKDGRRHSATKPVRVRIHSAVIRATGTGVEMPETFGILVPVEDSDGPAMAKLSPPRLVKP